MRGYCCHQALICVRLMSEVDLFAAVEGDLHDNERWSD